MVSAGLFEGGHLHGRRDAGRLAEGRDRASNAGMGRISVLLADDSVIVREGIRALLCATDDLDVIGVAGDFDQLIARAEELAPDVIITDIRMPPTFQREGIDAARLVRKRLPGTGVVILSQFDDPEYAIALLGEGASGYAYLLKDGVAEGDQLARAVRTVSSGGSVLDPKVVEALIRPVSESELSRGDEELLAMVAEGRTIKAIAVKRHTTGADVATSVEQLFLRLAQQATGGRQSGLSNLRRLHQAIVDREEQGETLSRLLPGGIADRLRQDGRGLGLTERLIVTVLISDVRGYSAIAETSDPSHLAGQLKQHRTVANDAILAEHGTVMQFVGDSVMAVFGAPEPQPDHAGCALRAAQSMQMGQAELNGRWETGGLPPFQLGIGLSTGLVAAALIGSDERAEYSLVGDAVNLAQRLQQFASSGQTVLSEATYAALNPRPQAERIGPAPVKGRKELVTAFRVLAPPPGR
jgi:class 3 adenylate cyclase/DNA-binding NarL/FixJ family response regulator